MHACTTPKFFVTNIFKRSRYSRTQGTVLDFGADAESPEPTRVDQIHRILYLCADSPPVFRTCVATVTA